MHSNHLTGGPFGSAIALAGSGVLCDFGFADGWPSIFYVFGKIYTHMKLKINRRTNVISIT